MSYSDFYFFVKLGWSHIISTNALDHILFILTLCIRTDKEKFMHWVFITLSFASGHTIAMTTGRMFSYSIPLVEFLIPLTIIGSSVLNGYKKIETDLNYQYLLVILIFGFIHGLGFSGVFEMMMPSGSDSYSSSLGFTLGLELSQISVLFCFIFLAKMLKKNQFLSTQNWNKLILMVSITGGIYLSISRWPFKMVFFDIFTP